MGDLTGFSLSGGGSYHAALPFSFSAFSAGGGGVLEEEGGCCCCLGEGSFAGFSLSAAFSSVAAGAAVAVVLALTGASHCSYCS